jgi:hypothetical protein
MVYSSIAELPIFDQYKNNHKLDISILIQELEQQNESRLNMSSSVNDTSVRANELKINYNNSDPQRTFDKSIDNKKKCNC